MQIPISLYPTSEWQRKARQYYVRLDLIGCGQPAIEGGAPSATTLPTISSLPNDLADGRVELLFLWKRRESQLLRAQLLSAMEHGGELTSHDSHFVMQSLLRGAECSN